MALLSPPASRQAVVTHLLRRGLEVAAVTVELEAVHAVGGAKDEIDLAVEAAKGVRILCFWGRLFGGCRPLVRRQGWWRR